jgi:anti-sigma B factor antagonist
MSGDQKAARAVPSRALVAVPAEVDMATAGHLAAEVEAAIKPGVKVLILDMTFTTFCDSSGLDVLARALRRTQAEAVELRLVCSSPQVLRVLAITGFDKLLPIYPNLDAAFTADSVAAPRRAGAA